METVYYSYLGYDIHSLLGVADELSSGVAEILAPSKTKARLENSKNSKEID